MKDKKQTCKRARELFLRIKKRIEKGKKYRKNIKELEKSLEELITEYDTSNYENRFVVGGAVEIMLCAFLNSIGFESKWIAPTSDRQDITVEGIEISVKGSFTGSGSIRLINRLGEKDVKWTVPTLFVIAETGICYADFLMDLNVSDAGDAITVKTSDVKDLVKAVPKWLLELKIPRKLEDPKQISIASYDVAKSILLDIKGGILKNYLPPQA